MFEVLLAAFFLFLMVRGLATGKTYLISRSNGFVSTVEKKKSPFLFWTYTSLYASFAGLLMASIFDLY